MKKKHTLLNFILYTFLIAILCAMWFIYYFNNKLGPGLIRCAEDEIKRLTTIVMNNCIKNYTTKYTDTNDLLNITRNNQNQIELIQYNTKAINQATSRIAQMLESDLHHMVKGQFEQIDLSLDNITDDYYEKINNGILFTVSTGSATGNSLLANIGPKIPLNLSLVGDVTAQVQTKITEYGLNNAMVEIFVQAEATTIIQMPFLSKKVKITQNIPLTMEIIQGHIPDYYLGNTLNS